MTGPERRAIGSNQPLRLDRPGSVWLVESGWLDLFVVPLREGVPDGPRFHLARFEQGSVVLGVGDGPDWIWLGVGQSGTVVVRQDRSAFEQTAPFELVENWLSTLGRALRLEHPPAATAALKPGESLETSDPLSLVSGAAWLTSTSPLSLGGTTKAMGPVPVTPELWWQPSGTAGVQCRDTATVLGTGWKALDDFNALALERSAELARKAREERDQRLATRPVRDSREMAGSLTEMAGIMPGTGFVSVPTVESSDHLVEACALVLNALGVRPRKAPAGSGVAAIAEASRCRVREVELAGKWWKQDNGPLLGFTEDGSPLALLPTSPGSYEAVDPVEHRSTPVSPKLASTLRPQGFMFYRPLPDRPIGPLDLLRFGLSVTGRDLVSIFWLGIGIGLMSLVMPIAIGVLVNTIIPSGSVRMLEDLAMALLAATLGLGAFNLTRAIAVLHMEGRMDGALQSAVMDRVLRLPVPFFRDYSVGDLANRALGINSIRAILSGATISTLMSSLFSLFSFALLFYYDWHLALVATALVLILSAQIVVVGYLLLRFQRPMMDLEGHLSGRVYQLLTGVSKLRVAGAEVRAFGHWARAFAHQRELAFRSGMIGVNSSAFQSSFKVLTTAALFAFIAWRGYESMNTGHFLAFNAAFGQFMGALTSMSSTFTSVLKVGPIMDRARPILAEPLEAVDDKPDAGELRGRIELAHVSFRYKPESPWVLHGVSLKVEPGEFVAIVGPSGAGKSTLLRLLLGFEQPEQGTVLYDDKDLHSSNLQSLRRQLGVVLQNGNLMPGDIFTNIVGSTNLTLDDAWEAARIAGIAEDIEAMPMGMHTVIPEGASTISGGQRQRLMIARAIVTRPRILFFDEATSALDAETQEQISEGIERLQATRVVIAHRLSTIRKAHRIYVISDHRVAQSGTFEELLKQPGEFAELARRQMT